MINLYQTPFDQSVYRDFRALENLDRIATSIVVQKDYPANIAEVNHSLGTRGAR
jgi:hypothetical protein